MKRVLFGCILIVSSLFFINCSMNWLKPCTSSLECDGSKKCVAGFCTHQSSKHKEKVSSEVGKGEKEVLASEKKESEPVISLPEQDASESLPEEKPEPTQPEMPQDTSQKCTRHADCPNGSRCDSRQLVCVRCTCSQLPKVPVCGDDGKTYFNPCAAECSRRSVVCKRSCPCSCSKDADCPKGKVCSRGACIVPTCSTVSKPVCGSDGKTYINACLASKAGAKVLCSGSCPCKSVPTCTSDKDCKINYICESSKVTSRKQCTLCRCSPTTSAVCGTNGKTYSNSCAARCQHITIACKGSCPCQKKCLPGETCKGND